MSLTWGLPTASRVGFALCASIRWKPIGHYGLAEDQTQPSYYYQGYMNILLNGKKNNGLYHGFKIHYGKKKIILQTF